MLQRLRNWAMPLGLLAVLIASFGLLIPWLGYYWDDWTVLITARMRGIPGYWEYYSYDRPVLPWMYEVFMPFLNTSVLNWQIFALLLRWGTTVLFWLSFNIVWPKRKIETALTAFLFSIYPIFTEQSVAVQYSQQWLCYFLFALSLFLMVWARKKTGGVYWILNILAVGATTLQMFSMEYFVGLEIMRPVLLWFMLADQNGKLIKKAGKVLLGWLPYLVALIAFLAWRLFLLKLPLEDPNTPSLLFELIKSPVKVTVNILQLAIQDLGFMMVTVWANLVNGDNIQFDDRFILFSWILSLLVAGGLFFFLHWMFGSEAKSGTVNNGQENSPEHKTRTMSWPLQAFLLGLITVIGGMMPIWTTNRQLMVGMHSDRFGMPAMIGTALMLVAFISWLGISFKKQILFVCILVGLAAGQHLRTANDYRWAWVQENRFYWQLVWRAPSIEPNTSLFAEGEFMSYMSGNAITTGINLLYKPPQFPTYELPYYFYSLGRNYAYQMPEFLSGLPTKENSYRIYHFNGNTKDALVFDYSPTKNNCLHVLGPDDADVPGLPPLTSKALANANLSLIHSTGANDGYPPSEIYGKEPDLPWCKLYQQAELARQEKDWNKVVSLGEEASQKGFSLKNSSSNTPYEWLPFVEGYALGGQLETAKTISSDILVKEPRMNVRLCQLWSKIHDSMPNADFSDVLTSLGCGE